MATSSALQLADLALVWDSTVTLTDLALIDDDLASDGGLETAVILSLFVDARAEDDDQPPSEDGADRRGWWADQFAEIEGDAIGSRLWLLARAKRTSDTARRGEEYVRQSLAWMLEDQVASSIDVTAVVTDGGLLLTIAIQRPGREARAFQFAHAWS